MDRKTVKLTREAIKGLIAWIEKSGDWEEALPILRPLFDAYEACNEELRKDQEAWRREAPEWLRNDNQPFSTRDMIEQFGIGALLKGSD